MRTEPTSAGTRRQRIASACFAALAVAAGAEGVRAAELPLRIVTSIPPLAMIASDLGGDRVLAHSILPPGADPHTFEPKPSDAVAIAEADVLVLLGSSIDDWIGDTIVAPAQANVVRLDAQRDDEHGHDHDHDPHVWLDPLWVRDHAVPALHRALVAADPAGAARYGHSARTMAEKMTELDEDVREALAEAPTRSFLAWHPAWEHFARRFGLHSVASVGEGEGREPSLHAMIAAIRAARAAGVRAVLVEPQVGPRQAAVLADELAVPRITVDPLGDAWSLDRSTYRLLMLFNARAFARALGVVEDREEDEADQKEAPVSPVPPSRSAS